MLCGGALWVNTGASARGVPIILTLLLLLLLLLGYSVCWTLSGMVPARDDRQGQALS